MDVSSRRVSSKHGSRGRLSRRSYIPSNGEVVGCGFATTSVAVTDFVLMVADFLGLPPAALRAAVVWGSAFSGFANILDAVTCGWLGASVTGCRVGFRNAGLDNSSPSDDVAPSLAQVHLLSIGYCLVRFRGSSRCV
jgi:hypothetical protein